MTALKIVAVGTSSGVVLSKDTMRELGAERGDHLYLTRMADGDYRLSTLNPEATRQLELARTLMRRDRELLRALADK
jgi:putative addiction module antidote